MTPTHALQAHGANRLLLGVAVVGKAVGGVADVTADDAVGGDREEPVGDASDPGDPVDGEPIEDKASNVGTSHAGPRQGGGGGVAGDAGRDDTDTGGEDVEDGAIVGEGSNGPGAVNGSDGNGAGGRSGRGVGSIDTAIAGGDDGHDTTTRGVVDGGVEGRRVATTERHVDHGAVGAAPGDDIVGSPVEAVHDDGSGGRAALEDLDSEQVGALGDTVGGATDGASNMGAVALMMVVSFSSSLP